MTRRLILNWRIRRWVRLGSRLFQCDPQTVLRIWHCVVYHAITLEQIAEVAERAGDAADKGFIPSRIRWGFFNGISGCE